MSSFCESARLKELPRQARSWPRAGCGLLFRHANAPSCKRPNSQASVCDKPVSHTLGHTPPCSPGIKVQPLTKEIHTASYLLADGSRNNKKSSTLEDSKQHFSFFGVLFVALCCGTCSIVFDVKVVLNSDVLFLLSVVSKSNCVVSYG